MTRAPAFQTATLRELLSHRGGISDGGELTTTTTDAALADYAYGEFSDYPALAPPGAFYNYSNPNFSIAGLIDQQLDGRAWADIVEADILAPLAMTRTVARKSEVDASDFAPGFGSSVTAADAYHPISLADTWETAFTRPAGLVWSTPSDQMRLAEFLVDGDPAILDPALLRELVTTQVELYPDLPGGYAFGLFTSPACRSSPVTTTSRCGRTAATRRPTRRRSTCCPASASRSRSSATATATTSPAR